MKIYKFIQRKNDYNLKEEYRLDSVVNEYALLGFEVEKIIVNDNDFIVVVMSKEKSID